MPLHFLILFHGRLKRKLGSRFPFFNVKIVKSRKIDSSLFITISCLEKLKLFLKQAEVVGFWCTVLVLTKRSVLCLSLADRLNLPLVTVIINVIIYYRIQAIAKWQLYNLTWMRVTARQCFPSAEVPAPVTVTLCQGPKTWINIVFLLGQSINWKKKKNTTKNTAWRIERQVDNSSAYLKTCWRASCLFKCRWLFIFNLFISTSEFSFLRADTSSFLFLLFMALCSQKIVSCVIYQTHVHCTDDWWSTL